MRAVTLGMFLFLPSRSSRCFLSLEFRIGSEMLIYIITPPTPCTLPSPSLNSSHSSVFKRRDCCSCHYHCLWTFMRSSLLAHICHANTRTLLIYLFFYFLWSYKNVLHQYESGFQPSTCMEAARDGVRCGWVSEWTVFSKRGLEGGGSAGPARAVRPTPGHRSPLSLYCVCRSHSLPRVTPGHSDIEFQPAQSCGRQDGRMNAPTWKKGECMKMRDWWSGGLMEAISEDKEVAGVGGRGGRGQ